MFRWLLTRIYNLIVLIVNSFIWLGAYQYQQTQPIAPAVLNDIILLNLAENLGNSWTDLAINLNISTAKIDNLKADILSSQKDRAFEMLKIWWQGWVHDDGKIGAVDALCAALRATGRNDLVLLLRGAMKDAGQFNPEPYRAAFIKYYKSERRDVPLLPWLEIGFRKLNDIYVTPKMQERQVKALKLKYRDIDSHEDMFKDEDNEPVKFVLLSGIAGSGKTTIVSKIATDWASKNPKPPLSNFTFVVALQDLQGPSDLTAAIFDQIMAKDTTLSAEPLQNHLQTHAEEVLVVLDCANEFDQEAFKLPGYINDIISYNTLRGCTVLVTTRPQMVDKLCKLSSSVVHIETKGFSDEGVQEYIEKFFNGEDSNMSVDLFGHLKASETLLRLARTPILLVLMCVVWSDKRFPETFTEMFKEVLVCILKRHFEKSGVRVPDYNDLLNNELKDLVNEVGKVALDSLISPSQEVVFRNTKVVEQACKSGILFRTKIRLNLDMIERVNFFHKTFQEALAGFYWASLAGSHSFDLYLRKVDTSNALGMEFMLRYCCGSSVKAAESLLYHVAGFFSRKTPESLEASDLPCPLRSDQNMTHEYQDPDEAFRKLWLMMHFEAHSVELHSIAETVFNQVFRIKMNLGNEYKLALKFLVECATSSSHSFLNELKQVCIEHICLKNDAAIATNILSCSPKVTEVYISIGGSDKEVLNEVDPGEALSRMQSLVKLQITGQSSNLCVIFNRLSQSHITKLTTLKLHSCSVNRRDLKSFFITQNQLCELCLEGVMLQDDKSPQKLNAMQDLQTNQLKVLKLTRCGSMAMDILQFNYSYPNLQSLRLDGDHFFNEDHTVHVCNLLSSAPELRDVDLDAVCLYGEAFPMFAEQLKRLENLQVLKLGIRDGLRSEHIITLVKNVLPFLANLHVLKILISEKSSVNPKAFLAVMQWAWASTSMTELSFHWMCRPSLHKCILI